MLTLHSLTVDCSDCLLLVKQQTEDPSLGTIRKLAEKQECGYCFLDGVILHCDKSDLVAPIVLLMKWRVIAMKLAHDSNFSWSLWSKKVFEEAISWPNINRDVTKYVREFGSCQKQAKYNRN